MEAWGGNESIVGEWVIDEIDIDDTETLECDNGNQITAEYELYVKREILVVFNENGSYYFMNDIESSDLN